LSDLLDRFADPTRCPDPECNAPVPELYRLQSRYVCRACGRWQLHTGVLAMPVAGPTPTRPEYVRLSAPLWRALELVPPAVEAPAPGGALAIRTSTEIAAAILAEIPDVREKLRADMVAASRGPHGGRGPLGVPVPQTLEEGLAWVQSPPAGCFLLPHLYPYFEAVIHAGLAGAPSWKGEPRNELEALAMLDDIEKCCRAALNTPPAADASAGADRRQGDAPPAAEKPVVYLLSWHEILDAVGMKNHDENRRRVRELNDQYQGPIIRPSRGGQPKVDKDKLLQWWAGLEQRFREAEQKDADTRATVKERHSYGKAGEFVPGIEGHVKKRRRPKRG
jgi:hypothetical protein